MIEVRYMRGEGDGARSPDSPLGRQAQEAALGLVVTGHAGVGAPGADPVCAGVSALVLTLAANLAELAGQGLIASPEIRLETGFARLVCRPTGELTPVVRLVFDTLWSGLTALSGLYPDCISCTLGR